MTKHTHSPALFYNHSEGTTNIPGCRFVHNIVQNVGKFDEIVLMGTHYLRHFGDYRMPIDKLFFVGVINGATAVPWIGAR
jgi:hypothetical protein